MERQSTGYELKREAIEIYEKEIEYYKKNLLKYTEHGTWITPRLISGFRKRLNELKKQI